MEIAAFQRRKIEDITPSAVILQTGVPRQTGNGLAPRGKLLSSSNSFYLHGKRSLRKLSSLLKNLNQKVTGDRFVS